MEAHLNDNSFLTGDDITILGEIISTSQVLVEIYFFAVILFDIVVTSVVNQTHQQPKLEKIFYRIVGLLSLLTGVALSKFFFLRLLRWQ